MPNLNCSKCFTKRAADGSWVEDVPCADHKEQENPEPIKRMFRVTWTEQYSQDRLAESAEKAMDERDDDNAFQECTEVNAVPICRKCEGTGKAARGASCGVCNDGVLPEEN